MNRPRRRGSMLGRIFIAIGGCLLLVSLAQARQGVVKTRTQTYEGEIDERDPAFVTITSRGITTKLDRTQVVSINYSDTAGSLADQLNKTNPKDAAANMALARQAFNARDYAVARDATDRVLAVDPNNADAVALRDTIQSQIRMERAQQHPAEVAHPAPVTTPATQPANAKLLRPAEINIIRQDEMRPDDPNMRIRFEHNLLRRYVDYVGKEKAGEFYAKNQMQQADEILDKGTPDMRQDVIILNDPPALLQYRRVIQPFIVQNCATSACHGGAMPASNKWSMIVPAESDAATYTNFYNLIKYQQESKQSSSSPFGSAAVKLVDRQRPSESLLVEYALPQELVAHHHPDVPNFRPPLRGVTDVRYHQLVDWIGRSLITVDPNYNFDRMAATQPATAPVTEPAATKATPTRPVRPVQPARPGVAPRP